ncbi:MAG: PAS domain S-box protein [Theionarchaea archaeon]|nr:PAS domain S-box protein [Theionarchaea archaeon]
MMTQGYVKDEELYLQKKDGTPFIGSVSAVAVHDKRGNVLFYDGIIEDISIRKEAEKKLRESEEKYRTLIEQFIQGIVIVQGIPPRPVFASPAVTDISGYTVEEIHAFSSEDIQSLIHPEDKRLIIENYRKRLPGEELPSQFEVRIIRKDGSIRWIDVHSKVIHYSGSPAIQAIFLDITERKKAEEQMKKFNEELERRITERSKRIELFLTVKQKLETEKTWERGLNTIIESMSQLGLDRSGIFLINHLPGKMEFHSGRGFDLPETDRSISLKKKDYFAVQVILEKKTVHIEDVTSVQGVQIAPGVHSLVWISMILQVN